MRAIELPPASPRGSAASGRSAGHEKRGIPMSNFDRNYATGVGAGRAVAIDAGLRAYMLRVYNYMAAGVALTGVLSWLTYQAAVVTNAAGNVVGLTSFGQFV